MASIDEFALRRKARTKRPRYCTKKKDHGLRSARQSADRMARSDQQSKKTRAELES